MFPVRLTEDLIVLLPRESVYLDPRLPERDMLRGRLMTLEAERRKLTFPRTRSWGACTIG